jgi:hypothetical protein
MVTKVAKRVTGTIDPLRPSVTTLVKLGSIIVHFDEATMPGGHEFDMHTARTLLEDYEVKAWISAMNKLAMLPVKRR